MLASNPWFPVVANIPTVILLGMTFMTSVPAEYGRSALTAYASLLVVLFGTLLGVSMENAYVVLAALAAGLAVAATGGRTGLALAALSLGVTTAASWATPPAVVGPAIALVCVLGALVRASLSSRI